MIRNWQFAFASLTFFILCFIAPLNKAQAANLTFYSDRAAFEAASTSLTTITFEGFSTPTSRFQSPVGGLTLNGVNFVEGGGTPIVLVVHTGEINPGLFPYPPGEVLSNVETTSFGSLLITLPSGFTAIASDVMRSPLLNATLPVTITLSTGDMFIVETFAPPTRGFFGFTSDVPITSLRLGQGLVGIDNFTFGQAATQQQPVPEPTTMLLLGTGLAGVSAAVRKRRKF